MALYGNNGVIFLGDFLILQTIFAHYVDNLYLGMRLPTFDFRSAWLKFGVQLSILLQRIDN